MTRIGQILQNVTRVGHIRLTPPNHRRFEPSLNINVVNCTNYTDFKKSNLSKLLSSFKKKYMSTWESGYGLPHCPSHYD